MVYRYPGKTGSRPAVLLVLLLGMIPVTGRTQVDDALSVRENFAAWNTDTLSTVEKINASLAPAPAPRKKSVSRAFFSSLLIPGLGEAYTGHTGYTQFFLTVETVGWGLFLANNLHVASLEEDYQNYAVQHAGVNRQGKDAQYWIDIGKYDDIYEFNEQRRRDRDLAALYGENASNFWRWDTYDNRLYYDWKRIQTRNIENTQTYIIGALVLNHLVSAINALRLARKYNRSEQPLSWQFNVEVHPYRTAVALNLSRTF
jgi:hypothetical protein